MSSTFPATRASSSCTGMFTILFRARDDGKTDFLSLTSFLGEFLFGRWDIVLQHNLSQGLQALAGRDPDRHQEMMRELTGLFGHYRNWSRKPDDILLTLDQMIERYLLETDAAKRKRLAVVFDYGQYLVPPGEPVQISGAIASRVVRFLDWARNPYIRRVNMAFCLVCENLSEVNDRLSGSPYVATIEIPMPDTAARRQFVEARVTQEPDDDTSAQSRRTGGEFQRTESAESGTTALSDVKGRRRHVRSVSSSEEDGD